MTVPLSTRYARQPTRPPGREANGIGTGWWGAPSGRKTRGMPLKAARLLSAEMFAAGHGPAHPAGRRRAGRAG